MRPDGGVYDQEDARAIRDRSRLRSDVPLVADIHFDYKLALTAIESGVDKIRINPGNIGAREDAVGGIVGGLQAASRPDPDRHQQQTYPWKKRCWRNIGRPCAEAMIESARKHVEILEELDSSGICLSFKSSDVMLTIEAYRLARRRYFPYPLHLGRDAKPVPLLPARSNPARRLGALADGRAGRHHPGFRQVRIRLRMPRICKQLLRCFNLIDRRPESRQTARPAARIQYDADSDRRGSRTVPGDD